MDKPEAIDLLREAVRLERLARVIRKHVLENYDGDGPSGYYLENGDTNTALEILERD